MLRTTIAFIVASLLAQGVASARTSAEHEVEWNGKMTTMIAASAAANGGKATIARECFPAYKVCQTEVYAVFDGDISSMMTTEDMNGATVARTVCHLNATVDVKHCVNYDTLEHYVLMKAASGAWEIVSSDKR